jgi:hypothetical protein
VSESIFEPAVSESAREKAEAEFAYLPDDVRLRVAQIFTAMESVRDLFQYPEQWTTFEAAKASLTAIEAQRRRPLSNEEIAEHHEAYRRAMEPWTKMLVDVLNFYPRPIIMPATGI